MATNFIVNFPVIKHDEVCFFGWPSYSLSFSQVMDFGDNMAAAEVDATWPETEVSVRPEVW